MLELIRQARTKSREVFWCMVNLGEGELWPWREGVESRLLEVEVRGGRDEEDWAGGVVL